MGAVVSAVEREVAQSGEVTLDPVEEAGIGRHGGQLQVVGLRPLPTGVSCLADDIEGPRSARGIQPVAIERCPDLAEPLCAQLAPVWELVASVPAPRLIIASTRIRHSRSKS